MAGKSKASRRLGRSQPVEALFGRSLLELPTAALAFSLAHPAVVSVCVGARSPEQIAQNVEQYRRGVAASTWDALRAQGLLRPDAPTL